MYMNNNYKFLNLGITPQNKSKVDTYRSDAKVLDKANYGNQGQFLNSIKTTFNTTNQTKIHEKKTNTSYVHNDWNNIKKNELSYKGSAGRLLRLKSRKVDNYYN